LGAHTIGNACIESILSKKTSWNTGLGKQGVGLCKLFRLFVEYVDFVTCVVTSLICLFVQDLIPPSINTLAGCGKLLCYAVFVHFVDINKEEKVINGSRDAMNYLLKVKK